jgi:hypothetical protein
MVLVRCNAISKHFGKDSPTKERLEAFAVISVHSSGRTSARVRKNKIWIAGPGFSSQEDPSGHWESAGDI